MLIQIEYDRKSKEYQWTDPNSGEILTAPAKCKGDLFRAALGLLDPALYAAVEAMISKHPQLERAAWRAAEIVTKNGVDLLGNDNLAVMAMVASSDGLGRYCIEFDYSCNCEHFTSQAAPRTESGRMWCKHALATVLWMKVGENRF